MKFNPRCAVNYIGFWAVQAEWFMTMYNAVMTDKAEVVPVPEFNTSADDYYDIVEGVAVIEIRGSMQKGFSKYGGTSTVMSRKQIRSALSDKKVDAILLAIDSPGGSVAGTEDLARDVFNVRGRKPIIAQVEDNAMSAALWVGAQADKIYATETSFIGSIGVYTIVMDTSGAYEKEGIKVHVISTGKYKGAFEEGIEVTKEQLKTLQSKVDDINKFFLSALGRGRNVPAESIAPHATGDWWIAKEAMNRGLIDGVQSTDVTIKQLIRSGTGSRVQQPTARRAQAERIWKLESLKR